MMNRTLAVMSGALALGTTIVLAGGNHAHRRVQVTFSEARIFFEYNSSEQNMGIQIFFDGEWTEVEIRDPKGRVIFETETQGKLKKVGGAEVRFESVEPAFDPTNPALFKKFPAGLYTFKGQTVDGGKLKSTVMLSHELPAPPTIGSATLTEIKWTWTQGVLSPFQAGLAGFQVIVEIVLNDSAARSLTVDLPPSATSLKIAPEFLEDLETGAGIVFEVLAIGDNRNRTITQGVLQEPGP